jgi:phage tail-like protein
MAVAKGQDTIGNHAWQIEVDKLVLAQFKEVSGLSTKVSVIEQIENKPGGIPVTTKYPGIRSWGDVKLKSGMTDARELFKWIKEVEDGKIDDARRNISIVLYGFADGEKMRFNLLRAWPSEYTVGSLVAGGSEPVMEELTLVHEGLEQA